MGLGGPLKSQKAKVKVQKAKVLRTEKIRAEDWRPRAGE
jgi:hypothetical protein